jgi:uncharacterized protein YneF (UPF0154 family)
MQYKSLNTSIEHLKKFFKNNPISETITLEEIYAAVGRDLSQPKANRKWVTNTMTHIRHHNLVEALYITVKGNRTLNAYKLTHEGKQALGREVHARPEDHYDDTDLDVSFPFGLEEVLRVMREVGKVQKKYPKIKISFTADFDGAEYSIHTPKDE